MPEFDKKNKHLGSAISDKAMKSLGNTINAARRKKRLDKNGNVIQTQNNEEVFFPNSGQQIQSNYNNYNNFYTGSSAYSRFTKESVRINKRNELRLKENKQFEEYSKKIFSSNPKDIQETKRPNGVKVVTSVKRNGKISQKFQFDNDYAIKNKMSKQEILKAKTWVAKTNNNVAVRNRRIKTNKNLIKLDSTYQRVLSINRTISKVVNPVGYATHKVTDKVTDYTSKGIYLFAHNIRLFLSNTWNSFKKIGLKIWKNTGDKIWRKFKNTRIGKFFVSLLNGIKKIPRIFNAPVLGFKSFLERSRFGAKISNFIFGKKTWKSVINPIGFAVDKIKDAGKYILKAIWHFLSATIPGWIVSGLIICFILFVAVYLAFVNAALNEGPYLGEYPVEKDSDVSRFLRAFTEQQIGTEFGGKKELGVEPHEIVTENGDTLYNYTPIYAGDDDLLPEEVITNASGYDDDAYELGKTGFLGAFRIKLPIKYPATILLASVDIGSKIDTKDKMYTEEEIFDACILNFDSEESDDNSETSENDISQKCSSIFSKENIVNAFKYWLDHLEYKHQTLYVKWGEEFEAVHFETYNDNIPQKKKQTAEECYCLIAQCNEDIKYTSTGACNTAAGWRPSQSSETQDGSSGTSGNVEYEDIEVLNEPEHFINDASYCWIKEEDKVFHYEPAETPDRGGDDIPKFYCKNVEDWAWAEESPGDEYVVAEVGKSEYVYKDVYGIERVEGLKTGWMPANIGTTEPSEERKQQLRDESEGLYDDKITVKGFFDIEHGAISNYVDNCTNLNSMYCNLPFAHDAIEMYESGFSSDLRYGGAFSTIYNYSWLDIEGIINQGSESDDSGVTYDEEDFENVRNEFGEDSPIMRKKYYWVIKTPRVAYKQLIDDYRWDKFVQKDGNSFKTASGEMTSLINEFSSAEFSEKKAVDKDGNEYDRICYTITPSEDLGARGSNKNKTVTVDIDRLAAGWVNEYNTHLSEIKEDDTVNINFTDVNYLSTLGNVFERYEMMMNALYPEDITFTNETGGTTLSPEDILLAKKEHDNTTKKVANGMVGLPISGGNITGIGSTFMSPSFGLGDLRGKLHRGYDFDCNFGTPVLAACNGTMLSAFTSTNSSGWMMGNVTVKCDDIDLKVVVYHVSSVSVSPGQHVSLGQEIAKAGRANGVNHMCTKYMVPSITDSSSARGIPNAYFSLTDLKILSLVPERWRSLIIPFESSGGSVNGAQALSGEVAASTNEENYEIIAPFPTRAEEVCTSKYGEGAWLFDNDNPVFDELKEAADNEVDYLNDFSTEYKWTDFRSSLLETTGSCNSGNNGNSIDDIISKLKERASRLNFKKNIH